MKAYDTSIQLFTQFNGQAWVINNRFQFPSINPIIEAMAHPTIDPYMINWKGKRVLRVNQSAENPNVGPDWTDAGRLINQQTVESFTAIPGTREWKETIVNRELTTNQWGMEYRKAPAINDDDPVLTARDYNNPKEWENDESLKDHPNRDAILSVLREWWTESSSTIQMESVDRGDEFTTDVTVWNVERVEDKDEWLDSWIGKQELTTEAPVYSGGMKLSGLNNSFHNVAFHTERMRHWEDYRDAIQFNSGVTDGKPCVWINTVRELIPFNGMKFQAHLNRTRRAWTALMGFDANTLRTVNRRIDSGKAISLTNPLPIKSKAVKARKVRAKRLTGSRAADQFQFIKAF